MREPFQWSTFFLSPKDNKVLGEVVDLNRSIPATLKSLGVSRTSVGPKSLRFSHYVLVWEGLELGDCQCGESPYIRTYFGGSIHLPIR
jgi:hypothetical protein